MDGVGLLTLENATTVVHVSDVGAHMADLRSRLGSLEHINVEQVMGTVRSDRGGFSCSCGGNLT